MTTNEDATTKKDTNTVDAEETTINQQEPDQPEIKKRTMKEAFSLLKEMSGIKDLMLYSYEAFKVEKDGKSISYTIVGYSKSKNKNFYIRASEDEIKLKEINDPDTEGDTYYEIDKFRDSPEMVKDVIDKVGKWDDEKGRIMLNMAQPMAQVGALVKDIGENKVPYLK